MTLSKWELEALDKAWTWELVDEATKWARTADERLTLAETSNGDLDDLLDAQELMLRADRAVMLCVTDGQERGLVRRRGQSRGAARLMATPNPYVRSDSRRRAFNVRTAAMTDDMFEQVIAACRSSKNISMTNAERNADRIADGLTRRSRVPRPNGARVVEETVTTVSGLVESLRVIDPTDLDGVPQQRLQEWERGLTEGRAVLRRTLEEVRSRV